MNDKVSGNGTSKAHRIKNFGWEGSGPWSQRAAYLSSFFEPQPLSLDDISAFYDTTNDLCYLAMSDPSVVEFIKEGNYDLAIATDYEFCPFLLFDIAKVPSVVSYVPTPLFPWNLYMSGVPTTPKVYASVLDAEHNQGFIHTTWHLIKSIYIIYYSVPAKSRNQTGIARQFYGPEVKDGYSLAHRTNILFANSNELLEKPLPLPHKIKYIGGLNLGEPKPLNAEFDRILSNAKRGAIVFSFGTQAPMKFVPLKIRKCFVEAFKRFPDFVFIWKYEKQPDDAELFNNSTNVHPLEWIPQWDLLNDKRVVGFISHSGLNSFNEASHAGVPMLTVPLFVDQLHNAKNGERLGTSILLRKTNITTESVVDCLQRLLSDDRLVNVSSGELYIMISDI
ncbi:hypothetical protein WR25_11102 [Diploscapter pachys]|uniref:glucuronosyltransferase n=1 Tax=Diploscapter pachys TaxID=2018661 RepID=A0A2A2L7A9_9BILA|nr:hypothetical protein WR25_11102 [Diploscapter pachys]